VLIAATTALAAVFLVWVAWAAWAHGTPAAESSMVSIEGESDSSAVAHIDVQLEDDVTASCRVRAVAVDHTTVGEIAFTPVQGRNDVKVRTERRATSIELIGCTTPDQERPR
jgi:hypothetical protein